MRQERFSESLNRWLATATRGLCAGARERIAEDIHQHVAEAIENGRARGLSVEDADREAVASLGDPQAARREFRKIHLTKLEVQALHGLRGRIPMRPFVLTLGIPFFIAMGLAALAILLVTGSLSAVLFSVSMMTIMGLAGYIGDRCVRAANGAVQRRFGSKPRVHFLHIMYFAGIGMGVSNWGMLAKLILILPLMTSFLYFPLLPLMTLWRKAGRSRAVLDEYRPGGPGVA